MPDCSIEPNDEFNGAESLHFFLKEYMENENHFLKEFFKNEPHSKYSMHIFTTKHNYFCQVNYCDFNTCFSNYAVEEADSSNIKFIEITKEKLEKPYSRIKVLMNTDKVIYSVNYLEPYDDGMCLCTFDFIKIDFPLPFKKGDIVLNKNKNGYDEFLVLDYLNDSKNITMNNIVCYECGINGVIVNEYPHFPDSIMNLELCYEDLPSDQNILYVIRDYLKDQIRLDYLLNEYVLHVFEDITSSVQKIQKFYSPFLKIENGDDDLPY